jgi:hypothetical protein
MTGTTPDATRAPRKRRTVEHVGPGLATPTPRVRVTGELLASLAARLTARDRWLLGMLHDHRVLTTHQIAQLAFGSIGAATHRLLILYRLRVLDRFRPLVPVGSAPLHYILGPAGAAVLAAERNVSVAELGYRPDHALAIAHSTQLTHTVGVNGFFTALVAHARRSDGHAALEAWWSERRCAAAWGPAVRPDGYGRWRKDDHLVDFFLEYDTGTEPLHRVAAKLTAYRRLAQATGINTPVLFQLPGPRREHALRQSLARPPVPVATTNAHVLASAGRDPAGPIWLPDRSATDGTRVRLTQVAQPQAAGRNGEQPR